VNGLVVSGGGSRGAHAVGGLRYLAEAGIVPEGFGFCSGTSVGAIICAGVAMYPRAEFREAAAYVEGSWKAHVRTSSDVWHLRQPFGLPALWSPSVGTDEPLRALLGRLVDPVRVATSDVQLRLSTVDLLTGSLKVYRNADLTAHGVDPVRASASFPGVFPPVEIGGRWETDGGARDVAPLGEAIKAGCSRIVVFLTQDPNGVPEVDRSKLRTTLQVALRFIHITVNEIIANDVRACQRVNTMVERGWTSEACPYKRVHLDVIYPRRPLGDPLEFDGTRIAREIEQGYDDTRAYFTAGRP
jgi:NTE family protein